MSNKKVIPQASYSQRKEYSNPVEIFQKCQQNYYQKNSQFSISDCIQYYKNCIQFPTKPTLQYDNKIETLQKSETKNEQLTVKVRNLKPQSEFQNYDNTYFLKFGKDGKRICEQGEQFQYIEYQNQKQKQKLQFKQKQQQQQIDNKVKEQKQQQQQQFKYKGKQFFIELVYAILKNYSKINIYVDEKQSVNLGQFCVDLKKTVQKQNYLLKHFRLISLPLNEVTLYQLSEEDKQLHKIMYNKFFYGKEYDCINNFKKQFFTLVQEILKNYISAAQNIKNNLSNQCNQDKESTEKQNNIDFQSDNSQFIFISQNDKKIESKQRKESCNYLIGNNKQNSEGTQQEKNTQQKVENFQKQSQYLEQTQMDNELKNNCQKKPYRQRKKIYTFSRQQLKRIQNAFFKLDKGIYLTKL
ncbi:hypothetical protein PPERSA_07284 [Pseudocohnilembus persalinus]|uniref:Uncharacterized protein n=1 Tax=Pseudocohnilembus persalinus TaxID=266149 RepID=A0A0V0QD07_PSEPJ|nr:hypothetical protein PPERSA_07284 [Pseudocohnilembus persalinus]|eukprot:KRX00087.1 hypothetical protein PPERSA_07284 [Pseudocohnilembus persalinus]